MFLGLPGMVPGAADRNLLHQAYRASEDVLVERAMLEDKIKATGMQLVNFFERKKRGRRRERGVGVTFLNLGHFEDFQFQNTVNI
jgi:hypothetical protein